MLNTEEFQTTSYKVNSSCYCLLTNCGGQETIFRLRYYLTSTTKICTTYFGRPIITPDISLSAFLTFILRITVLATHMRR